jgi:F-box-like
MVRRRKAGPNLLPKNERTEAAPKFQLRSLPELSHGQHNVTSPNVEAVTASFRAHSSIEPRAEHAVSASFTREHSFPGCASQGSHSASQIGACSYDRLPDDVLAKILKVAGFLEIVNATYVSRTWRRVAQSLLATTRRIETVHLFRPLPRHLWTRKTMFRALSAFPNLSALSLRGWPSGAALQNIPTSILRHFTSASLEELDVSGVDFEAQDLFSFMSNCPALRIVKLAGCPCVNDAMIRNFISRRAIHPDSVGTQRSLWPLSKLDISLCTNVGTRGLQDLLQEHVADTLLASKTSCRGLLFARKCHVRELNLASSRSLFFASFMALPGSLQVLNLSQCTSLTRVSIVSSSTPSEPLSLRKLNLAGNAQLHDVEFTPPTEEHAELSSVLAASIVEGTAVGVIGSEAVAHVSDNQNPHRHLQNIEELSLFGARALGPDFFRARLGLSSSAVCSMPQLKSLNVNGCLGLDRLVLVGYRFLGVVDCGGCAMLDHLEIRDAPVLTRVSVQTKRAPLRLVDLRIPSNTAVVGKRRAWSRETTGQTQILSFRWS